MIQDELTDGLNMQSNDRDVGLFQLSPASPDAVIVDDDAALACRSLLLVARPSTHLAPTLQRFGERHLVGVFEIAAHR